MHNTYVRIFTIALISFVSFHAFSKVNEVPFFELPTGQLVLKAELSGIKGEHLFILEMSGASYLRRDMNYRLHALGIDTLEQSVKFDTITLNGRKLIESNNFRIRKKLENRSEYVFPDAMLGTIGPAAFKNMVVQVNYNKHIIYIADAIEELEISDLAQEISFTSTFINPSPTFEIEALHFGRQYVSLDFSLPVNLNLQWANVGGRAEYWNPTSFKYIKTTLDGKKYVVLKHYTFDEIYVNSEISIYNIEATFSDNIIACIGHSFLEQMITTIDFDKGNIFFDPQTEQAKLLFIPPKKEKKK